MRNIKSYEDFISICNEGFIKSVGGKWNGHLDAFNDYLSWPEPNPYNIKIIGENNCKKVLGYDEMAKRLSENLETCHSSNRARIKKELEDAKNNKGQTLWDVLVEILDDNSEWVHVVYE